MESAVKYGTTYAPYSSRRLTYSHMQRATNLMLKFYSFMAIFGAADGVVAAATTERL